MPTHRSCGNIRAGMPFASGRTRNAGPGHQHEALSRQRRGAQWGLALVLISACALPEVTAVSSPTMPEPSAQAVSPATSSSAPAPATDAPASDVREANDRVASEDAGAGGEAGSSSDAGASGDDRQGRSAGATGSMTACACATQNTCCDGCQPRNEQSACEDDGSACTRDLCRAGTCAHELDGSSCLIGGECYHNMQRNPGNACEHCDVVRDTGGWVSTNGTACDDGKFCNGEDSCLNSRCAVHRGDPCNTSIDSCMLCDEIAHRCEPNSKLTWHDSTGGLLWQVKPELDETWQGAVAHCDSLTYCERTGWRLPTIDELRGIVDGCPALEPGGSCGVTTHCASISCVDGEAWCQLLCEASGGPNNEVYLVPGVTNGLNGDWSSTTVSDQPQEAWSIQYRVASLEQWDKTRTRSVRCVRDQR